MVEESETTTAPTLLNHALKWGSILGGISVFLIVVLYAVDYTMMVQLKFLLVSILISLGTVIYAGIDYRKSVGGFLDFGKAWQHNFVMFAVSGLIYTVFSILLYFVIDPSLPEQLVEASMDNTRAMMEGFGTPADQIDTEVEKARERTEGQFKLGGMAMGYGISLIVYAVLSTITALFARKNVPMDQM
jgi:hypothetical protein